MKPSPEALELVDMLSYCRPRNSVTEDIFRRRFLLSLPDAYVDKFRNIHVIIGDERKVLFSSHTDTVHARDGFQTVRYDAADGRLKLTKKSRKKRNCLGADDTVGCWIMRSMILARVPGSYVFHHGEESGCIGSSALVEEYPQWLRAFSMAIAFDRRGTGDVITHQMPGRTCSDTFAESLSDALNAQGLKYRPSDQGIYTDTAQYPALIAECTNVSVGYDREHSSNESVLLSHAEAIRRACLVIDWHGLTVARTPAEPSWRDDAFTYRDDWDYMRRPEFDVVDSEGHPFGSRDDDDDSSDSVYLSKVYGDVQRQLKLVLKGGK